MAYLFNEDKSKLPAEQIVKYIYTLLWEGNESESEVDTWIFDGEQHGVTLADFDEFEIVTKDGAAFHIASRNYAEMAMMSIEPDDPPIIFNRRALVQTNMNNTIAINPCVTYAITNGDGAIDNTRLIPVKLFGIKTVPND